MSNTIQFNKVAFEAAIECLPRTSAPNDPQAIFNAQKISAALAGMLSSKEPDLAESICKAIGISSFVPEQVPA